MTTREEFALSLASWGAKVGKDDVRELDAV
jgi:hypothetical protein